MHSGPLSTYLWSLINQKATSTVSEFGTPPGEILLRAGAMGPLSDKNPTDGVRVQAFAEILPSDLDAGHGVDVSQRVVSWINRRFSVNSDGNYPFSAHLSGEISFKSFNNGNSYRAGYSFEGTKIELLEIIQLGPGEPQIRTLLSLPLSDTTRAQSVNVKLEKGKTYQVKAVLNLESDLVNFNFQNNSVMGRIPGSYRLGSDTAPLVLDVFILLDSDGDGVPDIYDVFPKNSKEWVDTDKDGIGNNADKDDDNDGMPDAWEFVNGLNPLIDDSHLDPDGDGASNLEEYRGGTNPQDPDSIPKKAKAMPWNWLLLNDE